MIDRASNIPSWESHALSTGSLSPNTILLSDIRISDDLMIRLISEEDLKQASQSTGNGFGRANFGSPKIKSLMLLNLKTWEVSRIQSEVKLNPIINEGVLKLFCEGKDLLCCLVHASKLFVWRISFSQDYKVIQNVAEYCCENFTLPQFHTNIILYKQNLYCLAYEQPEEIRPPGTFGFGFGTKPTQTTQSAYREIFMSVDINTMKSTELKTPDPKPFPRVTYSSILYKNQLIVYGGSPLKARGEGHLGDLWTLDLDTLIWKELSPLVSPESRIHGLLCRFEDQLYLFGGDTPHPFGLMGTDKRGLFVYDITTSTWFHNQVDQKNFAELENGARPSSLILHNDKLVLLYLHKCFSLPFSHLTQTHQKHHALLKTDDSSIRSREKILFIEKPFTDITFKVQGNEIKAHKAILYASNIVFRNMFTSGMAESNKNEIEISDIKPTVFEALLEYIYCGSVEINEDIAWDVLQEADKYSLPGLKVICEDFLASQITVENVVHTINMAEKFEANNLRNSALKYVVRNIDKVFKEADIHQINKETLLEIYKMKH